MFFDFFQSPAFVVIYIGLPTFPPASSGVFFFLLSPFLLCRSFLTFLTFFFFFLSCSPPDFPSLSTPTLFARLKCPLERACPSYQPPRPSRLPEQTPSEIQNRNIMQYQNSASIEELAKSAHGLQRKPATSRLIFAHV